MANPFPYAGCAFGMPQFGGTSAELSSPLPIATLSEVRTLEASDPRLLTAFAENRTEHVCAGSVVIQPTEKRTFS